jgi:hypothetical protein
LAVQLYAKLSDVLYLALALHARPQAIIGFGRAILQDKLKGASFAPAANTRLTTLRRKTVLTSINKRGKIGLANHATTAQHAG